MACQATAKLHHRGPENELPELGRGGGSLAAAIDGALESEVWRGVGSHPLHPPILCRKNRTVVGKITRIMLWKVFFKKKLWLGGMGCSLFLDKMVEEPPAPKLQKPQPILAHALFDMFRFFCWLPSQSLTFDSWCISSCHMCCVKLWILARCPQCLGLRRQVAMPMPRWCCSFLHWPWFHGVPRLVWFCVPRSFVQASAEHRGRIQRSQSSRKALWEVKITATNLSQRGCNRHQSPQAMLKAQQELWWQTRSASEGTPKRSKSGSLGFGQGLHHVAFSRACTGSRRSRRCHEVSKVHVKPMWSPCEAL